MKRRFCLILVMLSCSVAVMRAQDIDFLYDGEFQDIPFPQFVEQIETKTGVTFYYLADWVRGIRVTASGTGISLKRTLDRVLLPAGLDYYMDQQGSIYLTNQAPLITRLPDYSGESGRVRQPDEPTETSPTSTEQKYIDGRKAGLLETLSVGTDDGGNGGSMAVIHGKMTDTETGEPLIGATIYIEELRTGSATDIHGRFSLVIKPGTYTADFNCMGMEPRRNYLEVNSSGSLDIEMEKSMISITEVTIQASRYHHVRGTQMGFDRLNYKVLKEVPVIMGEKDVLKVIQMLPGVQSVGEGSSGFNVRGSAADQNMIYVNKVPVYNSSHLFGFFTAFSPDIVRDFTLYKSNLPANYGGRLASFFDITTRQGNLNQFHARGGISPITGHVAVEGPIKKEVLSYVFSARSTYSDWILNRMEDPELRDSKAAFNDFAGALTFEPGEKTVVKAFGYLSRDKFKLGATNDYAYSNAGASLNLRHRFSSRTTGDIALVYGAYDFSTVDRQVAVEAYSHDYRIGHYELKADLTWLSLGNHRFTYGGNVIYYDLDRGSVDPYGSDSYRTPVPLGTEQGMESGVYFADEISIGTRFRVYAGLRYSAYAALGPDKVLSYEEGLARDDDHVTDTLVFGKRSVEKFYSGIEPRLSLNLMLGENSSLKASYNRVRQFLFMLSNTVAISPTDQWKLCDYHLTPPFVDQVSLGYYQDFLRQSLNTSLEVYHKWVSNVVEYKDGASFISSPYVETQTLQGDQKAYGFEAMIRRTSGKLNGWVSYSYSRSIIQVDSPIPGGSINRGDPYPSNYDRPHNLSMVANFKLNRRLSVSSNLVYVTGRPVTYPISIYYSEGMEFIDYSARNAYRIPDYFRLDFSLNLEGNLRERKLFHSFWMLNFYNITGRKNAYSVYFQNDRGDINGYKLSIFGRPVVTLSWNFKLGNYASE